jgi:type I restriction enzyme S subunit
MKRGWQTKPLGEVCERVTVGHVGITTPFYRDEGIMFLRTQNVGTLGLDLDDVKYITPEFHASLKKSEVKGGDILMSRVITHTVNCALVPSDLGVANCANVILVRPGKAAIPEFLAHYIRSPIAQKHLLDRKVGSAQLVVNTTVVKEWPVPLPPLPEQQRIVGLLDEAFEGIATAKANAEKNLQNARALFESHLQSVFTQRGKGWDNVTLETLLERGWIQSHLDGNHGGDYPRKEEFVQEGVPYISANCLDDDDRIDMSRAKYLSPARAALLRKGIAKHNDVLFAHNATVGPVAMLQTDKEKVILGTSLTYYRCNTKHILPQYLAHYMRSFGFKKQYLQVMRQSTRNQVPITKQREFFHVIPPLEEQKRIIVVLDSLLENGQRLAKLYERKLTALAALKQSLLHQAFSGEL